MTDREFELWTGSEMVSSGLEFRLETGPVTGLAELAYYPSLGLDPNWVSYRYLKSGIEEFHRKYILIPADKAANNVVVV